MFDAAPEFVRVVCALFMGAVLVQGETIDDRFDKLDRLTELEEASAGGSLPVGAFIVGGLVAIGINVLFGFWGKSRAEQHNVDPWIGFALGFVLQFIGVAMVPVFRKDRILNQQRHPLPPQQMNAPNPMYAPAVHSFNPVAGYGVPHPPPQAPLPPPPPQMLTADAAGYIVCPGCAARTKAGRKTCMTCGYQLPPVYDPNIR